MYHFITSVYINYILCLLCSEHAKELGNAVPSEPILFLKPTSSYITEGHKIQVGLRIVMMWLNEAVQLSSITKPVAYLSYHTPQLVFIVYTRLNHILTTKTVSLVLLVCGLNRLHLDYMHVPFNSLSARQLL